MNQKYFSKQIPKQIPLIGLNDKPGPNAFNVKSLTTPAYVFNNRFVY